MTLPIDNHAKQYQHIEAHPIATALGAEVTFKNGSLADLGNAAFAEIERALYQHGLLIFRGQQIGHAEQDALTLMFGEHGVDAFTDGVPGFPNIAPVIREPGPTAPVFFGGGWHTDSPFLPQPPSISILRSVEVPPFGADTAYASTRQAFEGLSPRLREMLSGARTLFDRSHMSRAKEAWEAAPHLAFDPVVSEQDQLTAQAHPLLRTHPVTGLQSLYVDETYTVGIEGMHRAESAPILAFLLSHVIQHGHCCRVRWEPDMLLIWDNRLVLHLAFNDVPAYRREMYRSTVLGEVPA